MSGTVEAERDGFSVSTDPNRVDVAAVHAFLSTSYWATGIPLDTVRRSLEHSLCFGLYAPNGAQVGFTRVITDRATYGYLCDVYVLDGYRGRGLAHWMMECVMAHPDLQGLRRWSLLTRDAHPLYRGVGFQEVGNPATYMEIVHRNIYTGGKPAEPRPKEEA